MAEGHFFELIALGIKCPSEFTHILTPFEFEELVVLYSSHESAKCSPVSKELFRKIVQLKETELSASRVDELMTEVHFDSTGRVTFEELCRLIVMLKTSGESRIQVLSESLATGKTTAEAELQRQAVARQLKVKFSALEIRETSDVGLAVHLTEVCRLIYGDMRRIFFLILILPSCKLSFELYIAREEEYTCLNTCPWLE